MAVHHYDTGGLETVAWEKHGSLHFPQAFRKTALKCSEVAVLFFVFSRTVSNSILPSDLCSNQQRNKQTDIAQGVGPEINASQLASLLISESA